MSFQPPKTLPYCGRQINRVGKGQVAGSHGYLDHYTGKVHDVFLVSVINTYRDFVLGEVQGNRTMSAVRVDRGLLATNDLVSRGDDLLVGPLHYLPAGPKAHAAWPARVGRAQANGEPGQKKGPNRRTGMITEVHASRAYGRITEERTGKRVFVHGSQLGNGITLAVGQRVSYIEAADERGPMAVDVRSP